MLEHKNNIITYGLGGIGIIMILLGLINTSLPPTLSGIGFLLLTWGRL